MEKKTRERIDEVVETAMADIRRGVGEEDAARDALVAQVTDVYRELAVASVISITRRRQRTETQAREREAQKRRQREIEDEQSTPEWQEWKRRQDAKLAEEYAARQERLRGTMESAMEQFKHEIRMEWTEELLASGFVLSDGSRVTWGEATVDQHRERQEMFLHNAAANTEGAARHASAIEELERSNSPNLNSLNLAGAVGA